jgi:hypothetical protein
VSVAFPRSDSAAPADSWEDSGHVVGLSLPSSPLPCACLPGLPCAQGRTQTAWWRWRVAACPVPAWGLPRLPPGEPQVALEPPLEPPALASDGGARGPYAAHKSRAGATGGQRQQGLAGATFPAGLCTLQGRPQPMPSPSLPSWQLASSAGRLAGACGAPCRVGGKAERQGLRASLHTRRSSDMPPWPCTAHSHCVVDHGTSAVESSAP